MRLPLYEEATPLPLRFQPIYVKRSNASRLYLVNVLTLYASLSMVLFYRFAIWCIQDAIDSVVLFAEQYVVVSYPEFICWSILQFFQGVRRKWLHRVSIDKLRHSYSPSRLVYRYLSSDCAGSVAAARIQYRPWVSK